MNIAFVVLTYNRSDALLAALQGLAAQCGDGQEVLVADDGSSSEHVERLQRQVPAFRCRVRHVWQPDLGFAAARARNMAVALTEAPYVVFLDGDCIPNPRFVREHEALAQPGTFVTGGRVLLAPDLTQRVLAGEVDLGAMPAAGWLRLRFQGQANKLTQLLHGLGPRARTVRRFRWKSIRGCNMACWRTDLEAVNGFDETFRGWGHEDAEFALRLHRQGLARRQTVVGTEVFHLWHQPHSRADEPANRQRVLERIEGGIMRAQTGLAEARGRSDIVVTELNR